MLAMVSESSAFSRAKNMPADEVKVNLRVFNNAGRESPHSITL